jgi:hypothetical protein
LIRLLYQDGFKENAAVGFVSVKVDVVGIVAFVTSRYFITTSNKSNNMYNIYFPGNETGRCMWRVWGRTEGFHRVLVGKPEGKRQLGRPRRRWENNIKMDRQEVKGGCGD